MLIPAWLKFLWVICCVFSSSRSWSQPKRVCYFNSMSQYRSGAARFTVASVDPFLCTHLVYAFAHFQPQGDITPERGEAELSTYALFNGLKDHNPDLKTLLAVGGWTFGSTTFSIMAADPVTRGRFVTTVVTFLRQHGFDGVDLHWQYPGVRGSAEDRDNFVLVCKELKQAFQSESSGNKQLILSAALSGSTAVMDIAYNIPALDSYLDLWNVMTFDYHGPWEGQTGHSSPLHAGSGQPWRQATRNVVWTAEEYVRRGASRHKVMVGLCAHATSYRLTSSWRHNSGSPASLGAAGPMTQELGVWAFYEVCQEIFQGSGVVKRDEEERVPYYVSGDLWISYDDVESIREKVSWLKRNGYGGFMMWTLDMDVFSPTLCPSVSSPYPLLSAASSVLLNSSQPGFTQEDTRVGSSTQGLREGSSARPDLRPTIIEAGSGAGSQSGSGSQTGRGSQADTGSQEFNCQGRPFKVYGDPSSSCRYIVCWADLPHHKTCPPGLVFDDKVRVCAKSQSIVPC